jgi:hypothetical protein
MLKPVDVERLAETIRRLLASVERGELAASGTTRNRLEGALAALEAVLGEPSTLVDELGLDSK